MAVLIVLDGWGQCAPNAGNAIALAHTPNLDRLRAEYPHNLLGASGEAVGLTEGQMGNSDVGHLNLGAGRVVYQMLVRIDKAIGDGSFFDNPVLREVIHRAGARAPEADRPALHLVGLLSDGGVHSHLRHLFALLEMARRAGVRKLYIHAFLDGRDVPPISALTYVDELQRKQDELGFGQVATVMGRYYGMDRDKRWERTRLAYEAIVLGRGERAATAAEAVEKAYAREETDEFVLPTVVGSYPGVKSGDSIVFFNFRADRARQISHALMDGDFAGFPREVWPRPLVMVGLAEYEASLPVPAAFPPEVLHNTMGEYLSRLGQTQLRIAETEKYAHVTFFFNGGEERVFPGEERLLIPSPKVATYDLTPEMSARPVTDAAVKAIEAGKFDFILLNYANGDMVGHTGDLAATIKAVEVVDECVGRIVTAALHTGDFCLIIGDHGNAEEKIDPETHGPHTAHTCNPVPIILIKEEFRGPRGSIDHGVLADVSPTVLDLMGLPIPPEMTGRSLAHRPAAVLASED
ncbi:MAG TPA: 2,3-bisphosphoglycerate-independent phosphoglycerate mutase [Bacillota bacterium]|jgi:2,3-bisphosphoglycerate-independent phosphoglycerate mutase